MNFARFNLLLFGVLAFNVFLAAAVPAVCQSSLGLPGADGPTISRELVAELSLAADDTPLALVTRGSEILVVLRSGRGWSLPLNGVDLRGLAASELLAFSLRDLVAVGNDLVWLTTDGVLGSSAPQSAGKWLFLPGGSRLETDESGGLCCISSMGTEYSATAGAAPRYIPGMTIFSAAAHGLFWCLCWDAKSLCWAIDIRNDLGQALKRVYSFSRRFRPTGCWFGPRGPEGEALLSAWRGTTRELMLIGQNGRMFWKVTGPSPCCPKDLAWDNKGNLLVLQQEGNSLRLQRWIFAMPEG